MKFQRNLLDPDFRVGSIDIQSVSRPKNYKHSFLGGREKHGFIYVLSGGMTDTFQNCNISRLQATAGDLIFLPKGSVYTGSYDCDGTSIRLVQFDLIEGRLPEYLSEPKKIYLPRARELIEAFFRSADSRATLHPFYYLACLYGLLNHIEETEERLPPKYKKLRPAIKALAEGWDKNEKVSRYAELCDMSEVNFRRLFREYVGASPIDYRNSLRLEHAKNKLQSGEYNVSEAAFDSGFTNLSFFIRLYKKKYGHTPKKE